jgi:hypothetical protein
MPRPRISPATRRTLHRRIAAPLLALVAIVAFAACKPDPVTRTVKPDASNTGWQHTGVTLTAYTGPMTITKPGTVIDGKDIRGRLDIEADDVTIQRSRLSSGDFYGIYVAKGAERLVIVDTELDGRGNPRNDSAVSSHDFTVVRGNIHGWVDGFKADQNVNIVNSWLHDFATGSGNHNDGIQISGRGNILIQGNRFDARSKSESGAMNASVYTNTDYGIRPNNVVVRGNWINAGGYFVRIDATQFKLENNRFGRWYSYGLMRSTPQSTWTNTGNVWDDTGQPIN